MPKIHRDRPPTNRYDVQVSAPEPDPHAPSRERIGPRRGEAPPRRVCSAASCSMESTGRCDLGPAVSHTQRGV